MSNFLAWYRSPLIRQSCFFFLLLYICIIASFLLYLNNYLPSFLAGSTPSQVITSSTATATPLGVVMIPTSEATPTPTSTATSVVQSTFTPTPISTVSSSRAILSRWTDVDELNGVVYFLYKTARRFERYDMNTETWLKPIQLSKRPTAFTIDADGIYVSFGKQISRFNLDGLNEVRLQDTSTDVRLMFTFKQFLYLVPSRGEIVSIDKFSGKRIDEIEDYWYWYWYTIDNISVAASQRKAFSETDEDGLLEITLNNDGTIGELRTSHYNSHNHRRRTEQVYILPGETKIVDSTGIIYNINDLRRHNNFPGKVDDLVLYGNTVFIRQGDDLISYSTNPLQEIDRTPLDKRPSKIFISGEFIFGFHYDPLFNIKVFKIPIIDR